MATNLHATHCCPVCESHAVSLLHALWQNRNSITAFKLHENRYFASCERCGTVFRFPLLVFDDTNEYGKEYYEVPDVDADRYIEEHVAQHQKYNYESIVALLREQFPPERHPKWLDVGSVGYPTMFRDYDFHTLEPSRKAVEQGKRLFDSKRIFQGTIETYSPSATYDGLLFNNSIYCLPSPRDSLKKCRDLLGSEGIIVVTLATYLNGAIQDSFDGRIDRVEDFLCGDTLHVYYNEHSLRYLFASAGFDFLEARTISAYGHKNMIAYCFRKSGTVQAPDAQLLDLARFCMRDRLEAAFAGFDRETKACLESIDKPDVVLYGEMGLMLELNGMHELRNVLGIIPTDVQVPAGVSVDGMKVTDVNQLKSTLGKDSTIRLVVVSFGSAGQLASTIAGALGNPSYEIYIPSRMSSLRSMRFEFGGASKLSKAFRLTRMKMPTDVPSSTSSPSTATVEHVRRSGWVDRLRKRIRRLAASLRQ